MLLRALLLGLACASAAALTPLSAADDDNECALYLSGPGRTSAYDYRLNLLRGNFGYEGQHTCITYDAVNQAYLEARKRILVAQPKGDWKPEDFASVGELILDISINLARTYGLSYEEIEKGLPLIDTSRTLIRDVCPPVFSHVECRAGKYRRLDGLCNNLAHPTWGASMSPFQRLIGPLFADGINSPRIAHSGHDLPLSRVVSRTMHPDEGFHDHAGTVMVIAWGQFMDHDYTLTGTPLDPRNRNDPEECCKRPLHLKHPYCNEIRIPDDDYFYRLFNVKCIDFVRGFPSPRPGCRLGSRVPFNTLTGVIDGNTVYGVTEKFARKLRTGYGGLLRMNPVFKEYGLKDLLPLKLDIPDEGCTRPNKNMYCFEAGEIRVNEQLVLTVMHTLMAREHNRVAEGLAAVNPHWDDETLFQEARRINIAEIQHITYNEFLPILLGKDVMEKFGLVLEKEGYWEGHDPNVNPDVIDAFAAAAYRFGHSLLPTAVERWSKAHKFIASKRLSDLIRRPYDLYRAGVLDEYVMGLMNQVAQAMDDSITQEVTNHLFKKVGARFGMDLVSFNMQRGREFGLPGYMEFRKFCGLSGADTFQELFGSMPNETVRRYQSIFEHPVDVDLWSGGVSERPLPGSMLGPTFACIIATQFSYSRRGDRFWFELPNQPSSFTPEQLKEVRKARLARVICDNTDIIDTVQLYPMVLPDHELNPRVPCRSGIIPSIDFSKWAEPPPFAGSAKQFVTDAIIQRRNDTDLCNNHSNNSSAVTKPECNITSVNNDAMEVEILASNKTENTLNNTESKIATEKSNSILNYVYKKSDKPESMQKSKGHIKNSLRRKKRSAVIVPSKPAIKDYETSHSVGNLYHPLIASLPLGNNAEKYIKQSDLAKFSIETLHNSAINTNDSPTSKGIAQDSHQNSEAQSNLQNNEDQSNLQNNEDQSNFKNNEDNQDSFKESNNDTTVKSYSKSAEDIVENTDIKEQQFLNTDDSNRSNKDYDRSISDEELHNNSDDNEDEDKPEYRSKHQAIPYGNRENSESNNNDNDSREKSDEKIYDNSEEDSNIYKGSKESEERNQSKEKEYSQETLTHGRFQEDLDGKGLNSNINDFDLEDLNYERRNINNSSELKSDNDLQDNYDQHSSYEESSDIIDPDIDKDRKSEREKENTSQKILVNINDDEVKPVVEIKDDSIETSEENDQTQKVSLNNDQSLETFLQSVNVKSAKENNDQITSRPVTIENKQSNAKQEFERIPLNYKHDKNSVEETLNNDPIKKSFSQQNHLNHATPEPKNVQYDENLNIKFDDISIKLPEIQLPEDIFTFTEKSEPNNKLYLNNENQNGSVEVEKRNDKEEFKNKEESEEDNEEDDEENNEESEEVKEESKEDKSDEDSNNDNEDDGRYHENYRYDISPFDVKYDKNKDQNDGKVEDLYEKFVRERFGKRDTFKKRSERLHQQRYVPTNPKLFETVEKILQKTDNTRKQADNSKEPKGGYMWTLEYGEKLV